ncbi:MAG TPA: 5'/3'-nucleotidase SurE, partial [Candidatus Atribacteria bacterium]|nr:5'/3'-nucleotidase SurE [Candidatus Atribacteria bacterium]
MDYTYAGKVAYKLAKALMQHDLKSNFLLNVNVPNASENDIKGFRVTHLGTRRYTKNYEMRKDPRGDTYFWLAGELNDELTDLGSDIEVTSNNYISITPLHFDLTSYSMMDELKQLKLEI